MKVWMCWGIGEREAMWNICVLVSDSAINKIHYWVICRTPFKSFVCVLQNGTARAQRNWRLLKMQKPLGQEEELEFSTTYLLLKLLGYGSYWLLSVVMVHSVEEFFHLTLFQSAMWIGVIRILNNTAIAYLVWLQFVFIQQVNRKDIFSSLLRKWSASFKVRVIFLC